MNPERPIRVAIVGGGCAGVTTAFELSRPEHGGKYEITIYQQGFRLGGKGASGRGPGDRIEEHGLHLWMGFYENAFRVMRECYAELGRDPSRCPIADWRDAFKPAPYLGVMERLPTGAWVPWIGFFPSQPGDPGDSVDQRGWTVSDYLNRSVSLVFALLEFIRTLQPDRELGGPSAASPPASPIGAQPAAITETMMRWLRFGELASLAGLTQAMQVLDMAVRALPAFPRDLILQFHAVIAAAAQRQLHARTNANDEVRRLWEVVDLILATIRGIIRFGLMTDPRGFEAIDAYDCREWLKLNGASDRSVEGAFLRALYDLAFAYDDGDIAKPRIAAGQALRGAVRCFFTYRGAFFWKMQAGMGDIVFAPFFEVLRRRGVRIEFFHRLRSIRLASESEMQPGEKPHVRSLEFDVQAATVSGRPYEPLVNVKGLPCWPSLPDYSQLIDGDAMRAERRDFESHWDTRRVNDKVLKLVDDFDFVVLAVGLGAVPYVAKELVERSPRWKEMLSRCKSVSTQAIQLWMRADVRELGWIAWQKPPASVSGFVEPFDTWADMSHLTDRETITPAPRSIAYFCSVLPDPPPGTDTTRAQYSVERREEVRRKAIAFLNRDVVYLWPSALHGPDRFRWELLCPPDSEGTPAAADEKLFDTQYWTANVNPSDRYSLSLPATLALRISPLDSQFDNLTVAGDWTDCSFNEGCVEAAVMSGRLAAHAISKLPPLEDITGYDHP